MKSIFYTNTLNRLREPEFEWLHCVTDAPYNNERLQSAVETCRFWLHPASPRGPIVLLYG